MARLASGIYLGLCGAVLALTSIFASGAHAEFKQLGLAILNYENSVPPTRTQELALDPEAPIEPWDAETDYPESEFRFDEENELPDVRSSEEGFLLDEIELLLLAEELDMSVEDLLWMLDLP